MIVARLARLIKSKVQCRCCSLNSNLSNERLIKVAILGSPNAGKSTLVNQLVGRPVVGVSQKVHTTREMVRAAMVRGDTQVVFVDTPGVVSKMEIKKHHLEESFERDCLGAMHEAHLLGVIHDVANMWTRDRIDPKILRLLRMMPEKPAFLVVNKVDRIKRKSKLLEIVKIISNESWHRHGDREVQRGWPDFKEIFMISALTGDGTGKLADYLVSQAYSESWELAEGVAVDQPAHVTIVELIRARLLDSLPEEVPYNTKVEVEYFHKNDLGEVVCVVLLTCAAPRHERMLLGKGAKTVREVALAAEQDACNALQTLVRLRLVVNSHAQRKKTSHS